MFIVASVLFNSQNTGFHALLSYRERYDIIRVFKLLYREAQFFVQFENENGVIPRSVIEHC